MWGNHHGRGIGSIRVGTSFKGLALVHIPKGKEKVGRGILATNIAHIQRRAKAKVDVWQVRNCSVQH